MHGQVSGEFRSQRRKSYGQAFGEFARPLAVIFYIDGTRILSSAVSSFYLGFYRNIYMVTVIGTSVIFHIEWEGSNVFLCPIFPAVIFFLASCSREISFRFCLPLSICLPGVLWCSQLVAWVFWLALSFTYYPCCQRPSIALLYRLLSQILRFGRQFLLFLSIFMACVSCLAFYVHLCKSLLRMTG